MSELGGLLELLHGAAQSFEQFQAEFRTWTHEDRASEAFEAHAKGSGATLFATVEVDEDASPEREGVLRVWFDRPDRWREEREDGDGSWTAVRVGKRWWTYNEHTGALTNEGDDDVDSGGEEELAVMLDPARVIGALDFEP